MFTLLDEDMNVIPYPEGVVPLDIFVSSISKTRHDETVLGRAGVVDFGFDYTARNVELNLWVKAFDTTDYRLLRNEIYALFDKGSYFYVVEKKLPTRALKVAVDDSFIPERIQGTSRFAKITITCRTLDKVFWESRYTTKELNDTGYDAMVEKYGLVDGINSDYTQYRFTDNNFEVYNAGNVTVRPEEHFIEITVGLLTSEDKFVIKNVTTGDVFEWNKPVTGRNIYIHGMSVMEGTAYNGLRNSNRRFITLQPGINEFEVTGGTFNRITFNFKYLYK